MENDPPPPYASHFVGVWERKVADVKKVLYNTLATDYSRPPPCSDISGSSLSREEFNILLQESATIVNSTPYQKISEDPNDPVPLSPQHLLTLRESVVPNIERVIRQDAISYGQMRWRRVRYLSDEFWTRWKSD